MAEGRLLLASIRLLLASIRLLLASILTPQPLRTSSSCLHQRANRCTRLHYAFHLFLILFCFGFRNVFRSVSCFSSLFLSRFIIAGIGASGRARSCYRASAVTFTWGEEETLESAGR